MAKMTVNKFQEWVRGRWTSKTRKLTLRDDYIMAAGLGGETGEVLEILKKHVRDEKLDLKHLEEELGDVLFYLTMICNRHGIKLVDVMETNVTKLTARKKKC